VANIQKRPDGRWRARYRDSSGKEHAQHFGRKVDAQRWLDETAAAVVTGTYVDPRAGRSTIGTLAPTWVAVKRVKVKPKTLAGYQDLLNVHVLPHWGDRAVSTITTADIEAWVADLTAKGLSASRTRQAYLVLKGILDTAVKARRLAFTPAQSVELPRLTESHRRYLTMAELEALADAAADFGLLNRVLGYGGLRWGEAVALKVAKCDLLRSRLVVDASVVDIRGQLSLGTTKSGKRREVPLPRFLRDAVAEHIAGKSPSELVFPASRGGYLRNSNFRRDCWDKATATVGLGGWFRTS
jgi:integrase